MKVSKKERGWVELGRRRNGEGCWHVVQKPYGNCREKLQLLLQSINKMVAARNTCSESPSLKHAQISMVLQAWKTVMVPMPLG